MELRATRQEYLFEDESGYSFRVVATEVPDGQGWTAEVTMRAHGFTSPTSAIIHTALAAKEFVRQTSTLKESAPAESP